MMLGPHGHPNGSPNASMVSPDHTMTPAKDLLPPPSNAKSLISTCLRVDVNHAANDSTPFPIKPFLKDLLFELQKVQPNSTIFPIDEKETGGIIARENEVPSGEALNKYVSGFQDSPNTNNKKIRSIRFFLCITTPCTLSTLKTNIGLFR